MTNKEDDVELSLFDKTIAMSLFCSLTVRVKNINNISDMTHYERTHYMDIEANMLYL